MTRPVATLRSPVRPAAPGPLPGRRPARGRARRAVLAGVGFAALSQLGMNVALDTVRPEWRDPESGHRLKQLGRHLRYEAKTGSRRPLLVVLGSSRTEVGLSPEHLAPGDGPAAPLAYNFSQSGCGPVGEVVNLHRLLAAGARPDFLLVEVVPALLADGRPADRVVVPDRLAAADLLRLAPYCDDFADLRGRWARGRVAPWFTVRRWLLDHHAPDLLPPASRQSFLWTELRPTGWMPYYNAAMSPAERDGRTAVARAEYAPLLANFRVEARPDRAYRDLLGRCRDEHVRAALLVTPESPGFRELYAPGVRESVRAYLAELGGAFGVPVFDASGWEPDEAAFSDGHHLLGHGAERFSRRLGRDCVGPWVEGGGR